MSCSKHTAGRVQALSCLSIIISMITIYYHPPPPPPPFLSDHNLANQIVLASNCITFWGEALSYWNQHIHWNCCRHSTTSVWFCVHRYVEKCTAQAKSLSFCMDYKAQVFYQAQCLVSVSEYDKVNAYIYKCIHWDDCCLLFMCEQCWVWSQVSDRQVSWLTGMRRLNLARHQHCLIWHKSVTKCILEELIMRYIREFSQNWPWLAPASSSRWILNMNYQALCSVDWFHL